MPPNEMVPQCHWCGGRCCSFGCVLAHDNVCRAKPEGGEVDQVDGQQTLAGVGRSKQEQDQDAAEQAETWKLEEEEEEERRRRRIVEDAFEDVSWETLDEDARANL